MTSPTMSPWQAERLAREANKAEQKRLDDAAAAEQARLDAAAQAEIARRNKAAADQRKTQRRAEKDARKAKRKAARKGRLGELGMSVLWATIIVLPITVAWRAQADFALHALRLAEPL